jgi:hypothetical protein
MAHIFNENVYLTTTSFFFSFRYPWYKTAVTAMRNDFVFVVKRSYHGQQMEKTLSFLLLLFMASQLNSTEAMIDIINLHYLHV